MAYIYNGTAKHMELDKVVAVSQVENRPENFHNRRF